MALTLFRRTPSVVGAQHAAPVQSSVLATLRVRDAERLRCYRELLDFYEGKHFPGARRGRTNLVVNYARAVVNKGVSYLFGRGVHVSVPTDVGAGDNALTPTLAQRERGATPVPGTLPLTPAERAREAESLLNRLAEENELDLVYLQAATNASVLGDAVLKVFWDPGADPLDVRQQARGNGQQGSAASRLLPVASHRGRPRVVNVDPFRVFPTWASDDVTALREVVLVGQLSADEARERFTPSLTLPRQGGGERIRGHDGQFTPSPTLPHRGGGEGKTHPAHRGQRGQSAYRPRSGHERRLRVGRGH